MAGSGTIYTVKKGDTLRGIASSHLGSGASNAQIASAVKYMARINNISNPDRIVVGQKIKVSTTASSQFRATSSGTSRKLAITNFGWDAKADNQINIAWTLKSGTKDISADHYKVRVKKRNSDFWYQDDQNDIKTKKLEYQADDNHDAYCCQVWAYGPEDKKTGKSKWTVGPVTSKTIYLKKDPPAAPSSVNVSVSGNTLTAVVAVDGNSSPKVTGVVVKVVIDGTNTQVFTSSKLSPVNNSVSVSTAIPYGTTCVVMAKSYGKGGGESDWTYASGTYTTGPDAPEILTCRAESGTQIYIEWKAIGNAKSYDIQYTTDEKYFDTSDNVQSKTGITATKYYIDVNKEDGGVYFFRVRAVNDTDNSGWSKVVSTIIGTKPEPPTTWSSTLNAVVGEILYLYWTHNTQDGSEQTKAYVEIIADGVTENHEISGKEKSYLIDTSNYSDGTTILWSVKTAGCTGEYSEPSIQRTLNIYAKPYLTLRLLDSNNQDTQVLQSFPFSVSGVAGPNRQKPISYVLTVKAEEGYTTVDSVGNDKVVNKGEEIYSECFDVSENLSVEFTPSKIDLEDKKEYELNCVVAMDSGLTAESSLYFAVTWDEGILSPDAEIFYDSESASANIRPYLSQRKYVYYKVDYDQYTNTYTKTTEELKELDGESVWDVYTTTNELVFLGKDSEDNDVYFCVVDDGEEIIVDNVTLSVYRREFDGSFTELATGIDNKNGTFVPDPHPSLDYARYRIVAISELTGAVSYYDVPAYPILETCAIIQWNDKWSLFDPIGEMDEEQTPLLTSMIKLYYNIDVSDKNDPDVSLINYIGRKHSVSYYGTQLGSTSSWSVEIPKNDKETLYALRRLSVWMGDVYVREPSGSGYYANVKVSFSQKHKELTIPVALDITRVEGSEQHD